MKKDSITLELAVALMAIDNALQHDTIQKKMAMYNYDRKKLLGGKALQEELRTLYMTQQNKYSLQYDSTDEFHKHVEEVEARYKKHLKKARLAFEDKRGAKADLQLNGKRKSDTMGLMEQIYVFYSKIDTYMDEITLYNVSREELEQTKAMVEAIHSARQQQLQSMANAQNSTQKRNTKRKELKAWMSQFRKAARLALHEEPQLLEALGISVRGEN